MKYWLIKTEPNAYSIDDLKRDGKTEWDGVRNYQARNFMRDGMKPGDKALFYHSGSDPLGVVGVAQIASESYPDESAFNPNDHHFDPKSSRSKPTWYLVDMAFERKFDRVVTLTEIKRDPLLEGIEVARTGSRLSVQPVSEEHFNRIVELADRK